MFIKEGTILPLAEPVNYIETSPEFKLTCRVYGGMPASIVLFEDDGLTYNFEKGDYNRVNLIWDGRRGKVVREGTYKGRHYVVSEWEVIKGI